MKTLELYTCGSGISLLNMGSSFGAWEAGVASSGEYHIEVAESAIVSTATEDGYTSYEINPTQGRVNAIGRVE